MHISNLKRIFTILASGLIIINLSACVTTELPKVSHVHVGHAITAWHETPDQQGLFVTAEKKALVALEHAEKATNSTNNIEQIKKQISLVQLAMDPNSTGQSSANDYGFIKAIEEAKNHMIYAADSDDASDNIKKSVKVWVSNADAVTERNTLIVAINMEILGLDSTEEGLILAEEVQSLTYNNIHGFDLDGNGVIGNTAKEYGIKQLKTEMQAMIAKENPPYQVVDKKYLFGLVRLPNGLWQFIFDRSGGGAGGY